jgi:acetyl esterase/lipase
MSRAQLNNLVRFLSAGGARDANVPIATLRRSFEKLGRVLRAPDGVEVRCAAAAGVDGEVVSPAGGSVRCGEVVYLHGGGYVYGSPATHRGLAGRLALSTGVPVWNVGYRLAPESPYPAALHDCLATVEARLRALGGSPLVLVGDSAGGGLVLAVLAALRERGGALPAAGVCLSPWTDLEATGDSVHANAESDPLVSLPGLRRMAELYLDGAHPRSPGASPLHADLAGLPPMLILAGSTEVLLDDARRVAAALERAGVDVTLEVWEHMIHVWPLYAPLLAEGQQAIERVSRFVVDALST